MELPIYLFSRLGMTLTRMKKKTPPKGKKKGIQRYNKPRERDAFYALLSIAKKITGNLHPPIIASSAMTCSHHQFSQFRLPHDPSTFYYVRKLAWNSSQSSVSSCSAELSALRTGGLLLESGTGSLRVKSGYGWIMLKTVSRGLTV